jgi:prolyl 4-hydroxylase
MITSDPVEYAESLISSGRSSDGVNVIAAASRAGHPGALFQQATWRLIGRPISRDLPEAMRLLRRAAQAGNGEAAQMEVCLLANGAGGRPNWESAIESLKRYRYRLGIGEQDLAILSGMIINDSGLPANVFESISLVPDGSIRLFPHFATAEECRYLTNAAIHLLTPALVRDPLSGRNVPHPVRTAHSALFGPTREHLPIYAINQRIASVSDTHITQGEALTILRYEKGQQFRLHSDALGNTRNERSATFLLYLNEGYEGGETVFPFYEMIIKPQTGFGVLFNNTLGNGLMDPSKRHAGRPVDYGTKWLATRWIRSRCFNQWTGPELA